MVEIVEMDIAPFGKARPRVTRKGTYMPEKYQNRRELLRAEYLAAGGVFLNIDGPVKFDAEFHFKMPKSWSKKKRIDMLGTFCLKTPDIDNLIGAVMDALLHQDQMVASIQAEKRWAIEDKIILKIEAL